MKGKIILAISLLVIVSDLFSQEQKSFDYDKFRSYFEQAEIDIKSKQKKIPLEFATKILGEEIVNENVVDIYTFKYIKIKGNEVYIIEIARPQGGYTSTLYMLSFLDYSLSEAEIIGYNALNMEGGTSCELTMINDTILEVKKEKVEYCENGEGEKVYDRKYTYYLIGAGGVHILESNIISSGRIYPQASSKILGISELENMKRADLDIMRNEIFADHGYVFRTEKWNKYFRSQNWYSPRFDNVTTKLTIVEKINVERILKIAPCK